MEKQASNDSNKNAVRNLLEAGERISVKSVWLVLKTSEARHYVYELRKEGLQILDEWVRNKNNQRYKEYFLAKPAVVC